ncbi:MAG: aldehyde ferredoxin oxidoreductase family protein [Deltaproteobacteria bacterium]|nr:aldehyde ferredoxin oxidoreductase family protein [Deltaproteobacteria bacterium]
MMYGWTGKILRVDLTQGKVEKQPTPVELAHNYLGGEGMGVKFLYDEVPPGTHPFDPKMIFVVGIGPLTGTLAPSCGRLEVISKSPMTNILGDSNAGGFFAPEVKWAGYDSIVIMGKSPRPVFLLIEDEEVSLCDAGSLWGKENKFEVEEQLKSEVGEEFQIMDIGIAGERGVAYSAVFTNGVRAAGMTGIGNVLGAKNFKAIAVRGTGGVNLAAPEKFLQESERCHQKIQTSPAWKAFSSGGTLGVLQDVYEGMGLLPVKNFQDGWLPEPEYESVSGTTWMKRFKVKDMACFGCPAHCGHYVKVKDGPYAGLAREGIEYYLHTAFTNNLGVSDPSFAIKCTQVCDELGLDGPNTGHLLAFAAEIQQKGIITFEDTGGIDLSWGNQEGFLKMIKKVALREGFGDVLADGFDQAAKKIGKGADKCNLSIMGNPAGEDLRYRIAAALNHLTSTRGADHLKGMPIAEVVEGLIPEIDKELAPRVFGISTMHPESEEGKEKMVVWYENLCAVIDSIGLCKFTSDFMMGVNFGVSLDDMGRLLTHATGVEYDGEKLNSVGERIHRLERAYNAREGVRREQFKLPLRYREEKIPSGPKKGMVMDQETMDRLLDAYFTLRGVNPETAIPTRKGLEEVDLKYIADDLEKNGIL